MKAFWTQPWRTLHRDQRGQAIFLGFFYFLLMAALVFLVLNAGGRANDKVQMQNTADAVAGTAADWYARGLNTISMCNVAQTQLMSVIVLLDSLETVAPVAQGIIDNLLANIGSSAHGSDVPNDPALKDWCVVNNAQVEQQMLRCLNDLVRSIPMDEYCQYDSGILWQCCVVLNELKTQVATITPDMAQRQAIEIAKKNGADAGFVLPFYPDLPIEPIDNSGGSFRNFRRPMRDARDVYTRRACNGYRELLGYASRRNGRTLGPFLYMREPFTEPTPMGLFELSRFSVLMVDVSDKKFEMLFGAPTQTACLEPQSRIEDYDKLVQFVRDNGSGSVLKTYWATQGFDTRQEYGTPGFNQGVNERNPDYPREQLRVYTGYKEAPSGYTRATQGSEGADPRHDLWYRSTERKRGHYPQIGIFGPHPPIHEDGSPWPYSPAEQQPYYHTSLWRFDGADVGPETPLHRRYLPPEGRPPRMAPIVLDRTRGRKSDANIFDHFSLVGFAFKPGTSRAWPAVFPNPVPTNDKLVCYAQVEVFNETSWDLFAQNWRAQLVRMNHWQWSLDGLAAGVPPEAHAAQAEIGADIVEPVQKMLQMYDAIDVDYITH